MYLRFSDKNAIMWLYIYIYIYIYAYISPWPQLRTVEVLENNKFRQISVISWTGMLVKRDSTSKPQLLCQTRPYSESQTFRQ